MQSTLTRYLAVTGLALLPTLAWAVDDSAYVSQVEVSGPISQGSERQVAAFSLPGTGRLSDIAINRLNRAGLPEEAGHGTHSIATQRGQYNRLSVTAIGNANATFQRQQGVGLSSDITLIGSRNAVAVDQQGARLDSDINVIGGNKVILHVQRGVGASVHHQPLLYTGAQREVEVILDTPKGRLTKTLSN
ncbi:hypothetical protein [Onishia taeanensis]